MAAVCLGAQASLAVLPVVAAVPVAVAVAAPVPVPVAVAAPLPVAVAAVLAQLTTVGTATPWAEQICEAKVMAEAWSAASQSPTRQQATLEMKLWFSQMHLASVPQPPYDPPVNCSEAQLCCRWEKKNYCQQWLARNRAREGCG